MRAASEKDRERYDTLEEHDLDGYRVCYGVVGSPTGGWRAWLEIPGVRLGRRVRVIPMSSLMTRARAVSAAECYGQALWRTYELSAITQEERRTAEGASSELPHLDVRARRRAGGGASRRSRAAIQAVGGPEPEAGA